MAGTAPTTDVRTVGLAIRDDGMLFPYHKGIQRLADFRPYRGDPDASLAERLAYLNGETAAIKAKVDIETGAFDIGTATKEQLADFALNEYGAQLDTRKALGILRAEVAVLSEGGTLGPPAAAPTSEAPAEAAVTDQLAGNEQSPRTATGQRVAKARAAGGGIGAVPSFAKQE